MKFTSSLPAALLCTLLSGCAALNFEPVTQTTDTNTAHSEAVSGLEQTEPQLSPLQQKAANLKNSPNRYLSNPVAVPQHLRKLYTKAIDAKLQGDNVQAKTILEHISQQAPHLSGPYLHLGDIAAYGLNGLDDSKQAKKARNTAIEYYQAAIKANVNNYYAHNRLAMIYRDSGEFELAKQHYQQALDSWPGFANGYLNLGILYDLYLNNKHLALKHYQTYQLLQEQPERRVNGWIADITRQLKRTNNVPADTEEAL